MQLGSFLTEDFPPVPETMRSFFQCIGFEIPNDYFEFMSLVNGGYLFSDVTFLLRNKPIQIKEFYAFVPGSIVGQPFTWIYNNAIRPARLFEFASTTNEGYIALWLDDCLGSVIDEGAIAGEVWYFSDRVSGLNVASDYSELKKNRGAKLIANSFALFIGSLKQQTEQKTSEQVGDGDAEEAV